MLPDPLHPAVVHFPIALSLLLPLAALLALVVHYRGARWRHTWLPVVAAAAALALSSWAAAETGEDQEDVVERVVAEDALENHEEKAETFQRATIVVFLLTAAGLAPGKAGHGARIAAGAGMAVILYLGINVGHSGGELVYRHGAAQAYTSGASVSPPPPDDHRHHDDDHD